MFDQIASLPHAGPLHEKRWPRHNMPGKGQVLGGTCNRTGCDETGAVFWNALTFGFYCPCCAAEINAGPTPACEPVDEKPCLDEMNRRHRYAVKAYRH